MPIMASVSGYHTSMIPVFCNAEISTNILDDFLDEAYTAVKESHRRLFLVTSKSLPSNLQPSTSPVGAFESPFLGEWADRHFIFSVSSHGQINGKVFVVLDKYTLTRGHTCRLVSLFNKGGSVRSDFYSVQVALDAMLDGTTNLQRLRNEAEMVGGKLQKYHANEVANSNHERDFLGFQNRPSDPVAWEQCCYSRLGYQDPICIPVFCTVEMPVKILNEFIESVYRPSNWDEEPGDFPCGIRIIDSTDLAKLQSAQTRSRYTEPFVSPFLGQDPQMIRRTVESQFPDTKLNCATFVILDAHTLKDQMCTLADMSPREDPYLILVRSRFSNVLSYFMASTCTGLTYDGLSEERALRLDDAP